MYQLRLPFLNFKSKSAQSVFPSVKQANASVKTNRWKEGVFVPGHEMQRKMKTGESWSFGCARVWLAVIDPPSGWLVCLESGQQLCWRVVQSTSSSLQCKSVVWLAVKLGSSGVYLPPQIGHHLTSAFNISSFWHFIKTTIWEASIGINNFGLCQKRYTYASLAWIVSQQEFVRTRSYCHWRRQR